MTIFQAIILGIVEGITEFLPVSSTAHLIIGQKLLGITDVSEFFTAVVQIGALGGLLVAERKRLWEMAIKLADTRKAAQKKKAFIENEIVHLALATIPVLIVGFFVKDYLDTIYNNPGLIACMSVGVGLVLLVAQHVAAKQAKGWVSGKDIFVMGLFQVISLIPGTSRSGITAAGGAFQKMSLPQALEFSFLLSIPALAMAGGYEILKFVLHGVESDMIVPTIVGTLVSFVAAIIGIEFLRASVKKLGFTPFVIYRFFFAAVILFLM